MKYEYMELEGDEGYYDDNCYQGRSEVTLADLNRAGAEGWKIVHVSQYRVLLMREIKDEHSPLVQRVLDVCREDQYVDVD